MDRKQIQIDIENKLKAYKKSKSGKSNPLELTDFLTMVAPLYDLYSATTNGDKAYYKWTKKNDKLNKPNFNWNEYFENPKPISYKSTTRVTGIEKIDVRGLPNFKDDFIEVNQTAPSGYMLPSFDFINIPYSKFTDKGEGYRVALELFGLYENDSIKPDIIPLISSYRDTLFVQLNRQIEEINRINSEISDVLKVYYYESENSLNKKYSESNSEDEKQNIADDRIKILTELKNFFKIPILGGAGSDIIKASWLKRFKTNTYVSNHIIESTLYGIDLLTVNRDPILNMSVEIAKKITPLESILEDAFLNNKIRAHKDYLKENLTQAEIIQKAHELRDNGMNVLNMFHEMKKWLLTELGFTNDELVYNFGFRFHEHEDAHTTFSRFVNKNRLKHNKE